MRKIIKVIDMPIGETVQPSPAVKQRAIRALEKAATEWLKRNKDKIGNSSNHLVNGIIWNDPNE